MYEFEPIQTQSTDLFDYQPDTHLEYLKQKGKEFVHVQMCEDRPYDRTLYVPISWMKKHIGNRESLRKEKQLCFYSLDPAKPADFEASPRQRLSTLDSLYTVKVLRIYKARQVDNVSSSKPEYQEETTLLQSIDGSNEQSTQQRIKALDNIATLLASNYLPELIQTHRETLVNAIVKSLRRCISDEQRAAMKLTPLLILHCTADCDRQNVITRISPILMDCLQNNANVMEFCSECCSAIAVSNFFVYDDLADLVPIMHCFQRIFTGVDSKKSKSAEGQLYSAALNGWNLLFTLIPSSLFTKKFQRNEIFPSLDQLMNLWQHSDQNVRVAAAETIALMLESGRTIDTDFLEEHHLEIIDTIKENLSLYKNKIERDTLRDVLRFIEKNHVPEKCCHFDRAEHLDRNTWFMYVTYNAVQTVLRSGMNTHLKMNELMRNCFQLGEVKPKVHHPNRTYHIKKEINHLRNVKNRALKLSRNRDIRVANID